MRSLSRLTCLIAACALLVPAMPAAAQMTGSRIGKNAGVKDVPALMRLMAECIVARRQGMVRDWLVTLPGSDEEDRLLTKQLGDFGLCLEDRELVMGNASELVVTPKSVRFPLALALARKQLRKGPAMPEVAKAGEPWFTAKLAKVTDIKQVDRVQLALQDFGHCVATANWSGSSMLVLAETGSPQEQAAVTQLIPVLGPCLDQNAKINLNAANLRTAVAEPMAHILMASSGS